MALKSVRAELVLDDLKDAFWRVTTTDQRGASMTKVLSHETYVNLLKANTIVRKEPKKHRLGKLPYGYVDCLYGSPGNYTIAVLYPEKVRGIKYFKDTFRVIHPHMLFIYSIKKGVVQSRRCFAVKDTDITEDTVLYRFPFGNVGEDNGNMCYGGIKLPDCTELSSIDELVQLFLNGEVNDDLYRPSKTTKNCKQFQLYKYLTGKKKFPYSILIAEKAWQRKDNIRFKDVFK